MSDFGNIAEITAKALQFKQKYYSTLDDPAKRPELLNSYSEAHKPIMQWNGHMLNTMDEVATYLSSLPKTKHEVFSVDAQPLPGCQNADSLLVVATGRCIYDDEHHRFFYQRFVLRLDDQRRLYIMNDYLRWTGESS